MKACIRFLTFTVEAAFAEAPRPSSLHPAHAPRRIKGGGKKKKQERKEEREKERPSHLTSIAELSVCVPPSHWYLDEARGTVTRALRRKAYDVIEVPSL